jgi:DnaK suppressor protein
MTSRRTVARDNLTESELAQFESALRQQREFRMTQLAELDAADASASTAAAYAPEVRDVLAHAAWHALKEADRALERLDAGSYGSCVACAAPIGRDRLEVLPAAALCMGCQHRVSRRAKPPAGRARATW